jgi:hypothetical protein
VALQACVFLLGVAKPVLGSDFPGLPGSQGLEGPGVSGFGPDFPLIPGLGLVTALAFGGSDDFMAGDGNLRQTEYQAAKHDQRK